LTVPGVVNSLQSVNRSKFNGKETVHERGSDSQSDEMGRQISRGVYPEVPAQSVVWAVTAVLGRGVPGVSAAAGESGRRRALAADHVPMRLSIPPKYAVAQVGGYLKGKSAIHLART
jgi:hypothetical protein